MVVGGTLRVQTMAGLSPSRDIAWSDLWMFSTPQAPCNLAVMVLGSTYKDLAAKPSLGLSLPSKTTNCDLRKMSPKMEKPIPALD